MSLSLQHTFLFLTAVLIGVLVLAAGCIQESKAASADMRSTTGPGNLTYYTERPPPV